MKLERRVVVSRGTRFQCGFQSGQQLSSAIAANLDLFWQAVATLGMSREQLLSCSYEDETRLSAAIREEIRGLAAGSGVEYRQLLAYNLYRGGIACDC